MKILLINPPWYCLQNLRSKDIPLGLCYLASSLRNNGHECMIFDADLGFGDPKNREELLVDFDYYLRALEDHPVWTKAESVIRDFQPDICGISVYTGKYGSAKRIASIAKQCAAGPATIVMGGPHPTLLPAETLQETEADIVVRGEGEVSFAELAACIESKASLSDVLGISYKQPDGTIRRNPDRPFVVDLDTIPIPARELIFEKELYETDAFGSIITSRGCPYKCIFCSSPKIWSRKVRFRTPQSVVVEVEHVKSTFGTKMFRFNDDSFSLIEKRIVSLCSLLEEKQLDILWQCDTRVHSISEDLLGKMKKAGCVQVNLGIESGNPEILKAINKGITIDQVQKAFAITRKIGVRSYAYFMLGFPGETRQQVMDTVNLMKQIRPSNSCWSIATPYPGTELHDIAVEKNLIPISPNWSEYFHHSRKLNLSSIPDDEFHQLIDQIQQEVCQSMNFMLSDIRFIYQKRIKYYLKRPALMLHDIKLGLRILWARIRHALFLFKAD